MIKVLTIRDFQSHRETSLKFSPGVNLFIGQSDSGKTAILRALKWLATNRPLGDGFVSWGSKKETVVTAVLNDDATVIHKQGCYILQNGVAEQTEQQEWSAIGTGVPETVIQALNISDLSWQSQMDAPFLLSSSPGEVARTLNEVADLDKIDSTLANINHMAKENRTQLLAEGQLKQELEINLSEYRGLDDRLKRIKQFHEMDKRATLLEEMVSNGCTILQEIKEQEERLSKAKDMTDAEEELKLLMDMVGQLEDIELMEEKMTNQVVQIAKSDSYLKEVSERLIRLEKTWKEDFPEVCPLCGRTN